MQSVLDPWVHMKWVGINFQAFNLPETIIIKVFAVFEITINVAIIEYLLLPVYNLICNILIDCTIKML